MADPWFIFPKDVSSLREFADRGTAYSGKLTRFKGIKRLADRLS